MTDPMILAAAIVVVVTAVAKGWVDVIKQRQAVALMEDIKRDSEALKIGNKEIHGLVNSAASKTAEEITALKATITGLHAAMSALQSQRVTDAQHVAQSQAGQTQPQTQAAAAPVVATQVVEHQVVDRQSIKK